MDKPVDDLGSARSYMLGLLSSIDSRMLKKKDFEILTESTDLQNALNHLESIGYLKKSQDDLEKDIGHIQSRVRETFYDSYSLIIESVPTDDSKMIRALFEGLWDIKNIMICLRLVRNKQFERAQDIFNNLGLLKESDLAKIASCETTESAIDAIDERYRAYFSGFLDESGWGIFEDMAEKRYLESLTGMYGGFFSVYLGSLIDLINLRTSIYCIKNEVDPTKSLISGGYNISPAKAQQMVRSDLSQALTQLSHTPYHRGLQEGMSSQSAHMGIDPTDKLKSHIRQLLKNKAIEDPFCIASPLAAIEYLDYECDMVLRALTGVWAKLTPDEIKELIS